MHHYQVEMTQCTLSFSLPPQDLQETHPVTYCLTEVAYDLRKFIICRRHSAYQVAEGGHCYQGLTVWP